MLTIEIYLTFHLATAPGDFTATIQTLVFAVGSGPGTRQQLTIPITNDNVVENQEVINIQANIIGEGGTFFGGGTVATAIVNINDDDRKLGFLHAFSTS